MTSKTYYTTVESAICEVKRKLSRVLRYESGTMTTIEAMSQKSCERRSESVLKGRFIALAKVYVTCGKRVWDRKVSSETNLPDSPCK